MRDLSLRSTNVYFRRMCMSAVLQSFRLFDLAGGSDSTRARRFAFVGASCCAHSRVLDSPEASISYVAASFRRKLILRTCRTRYSSRQEVGFTPDSSIRDTFLDGQHTISEPSRMRATEGLQKHEIKMMDICIVLHGAK